MVYEVCPHPSELPSSVERSSTASPEGSLWVRFMPQIHGADYFKAFPWGIGAKDCFATLTDEGTHQKETAHNRQPLRVLI